MSFFVAANNSGKSRLLRNVAGRAGTAFLTQGMAESNAAQRVGPAIAYARQFAGAFYQRFRSSPMMAPALKALEEIQNQPEGVNDASLQAAMCSMDRFLLLVPERGKRAEGLQEAIGQYMGDSRVTTLWDEFEKSRRGFVGGKQFKYEYIPSRRSLRTLDNGATLLTQIERDYIKSFPLLEKHITTGEEMYELVRKQKNGTHHQQQTIRRYEDFLSRSFFNSASVTLTSRADQEILYIKVGDEVERPLYELGDGLQQIIIITYNGFISTDEPYVSFIEEPELYLHPGMQRSLIQAYLSEANLKNCQLFIATHSNHLMDMAIDSNEIRVFRLEKDVHGTDDQRQSWFTIHAPSIDDFAAIDALGVRPSSVLIANCSIWVEGITDRLFFSSLVRHHLQASGLYDLKEDLHYTFVEYGGGNIPHFNFSLERDTSGNRINVRHLTSPAFVIVDSDIRVGKVASRAKQIRHAALAGALEKHFYKLPVPEVENIISPPIVMRALSRWLAQPPKVTIDPAAYRTLNVGEYLTKTAYRGDPPKVLAASNGALHKNAKLPFIQSVISETNSLADFSDEARLLGQMLVNFVLGANGLPGLTPPARPSPI